MPSLIIEPGKDAKAKGSKASGGGAGGRSKATDPRKDKRKLGGKEDPPYTMQRFNNAVETHELTALGKAARPLYRN
ncbi:hypothetical protein LTR91_021640 [Friedmanniomyces endolithicus]|uniref:Uncharacterized protein n=2 Tax=Dothideomycetidae TaxID=451867 RepID=A0AAN6K4H3_9PEZI|nr:hypothetical protein LTR94_018023 [Friedmanniomyces endolithicus]KAK0788788.1 hypothetical protein LTR75_012487 [Friedmanniomyces endolithicus]KAK0804626.1 hypothetical protein LTR38_005731 [Friedmanniomyces endolithicus]KAK0840460.1 hypothetical protein LTR03_010578 [Friedmanniomyces endolithicus]KAK0866627.1 hypothetical protein LTR87_014930 [Friedmanniomyces endolithicus]